MKRLFSLCLLLVLGNQVVTAQQTLIVTGSVKDEKGNPVPYAFIRDRPYKYAVYADSVGMFKIEVNPNSYLEFKGPGYTDQHVKLNGNTDLQVVLQHDGSETNSAGASTGGSFKTTVLSQHSANDNQNFSYGDGARFAAPKKEDAHGSKYLFDDWVHGYFINPTDSLAQNSAYLYNYDKIGGELLITQDRNTAIAVDPKQFKTFTLFDNSGQGFTFEKVTAIDGSHYVQVLAKGTKYGIYKKIYTHFEKANYSSNGIASSGNKYDEYIDEPTYYVLNVQTNAVQKVTLKKKALKDAFPGDADKLNKFMADHSSDTIDDFYLASLGSYMNE